MGGCWRDQRLSPGLASGHLAGGLGRVVRSPVWGLGRVMWSWGLGCISTNGSSTETSLWWWGGGSMKGQHPRAGGEPPPPAPPPSTHPPRDTTSFTLTL